MKILNLIHSCNPEGGGPWEAVLQFTLEHIKNGHEVMAASTDGPNTPWCKNAEVPITPLGPARNGYGHAPRLFHWLNDHAKKYDCAIIHGLWQYPGRTACKILPKQNVPYFVYPHGMLDPWFKQAYPLKHLKKVIYWKIFEHQLLRKAQAVLFTCEEERRLAQNTFSPYKCQKAIAPLGINAPGDDPAKQVQAFLSQFPHLEGQRFFLYLSRIHEKKGLDLLLDALAQARRPLPQLVIAGPNTPTPYIEKLKRMEDELAGRQPGWEITWTGMLTGMPKWGALRAADAFVLPSHQENFGIAVVEALAVGTPVLLSRKVNIWREIVKEQAGIAEEDTVEGTLKTLNQWDALSEDSQRKMGNNARLCFARHFEISQAAKHLLEVLQGQASSASAIE